MILGESYKRELGLTRLLERLWEVITVLRRILGVEGSHYSPLPLLGGERERETDQEEEEGDGDGAAASAAGPHRAAVAVAGGLAAVPPAAADLRLPPAPLAGAPPLLRRIQALPRRPPRLRRPGRGPLRRLRVHGAHPPPRRPRRRRESELHACSGGRLWGILSSSGCLPRCRIVA